MSGTCAVCCGAALQQCTGCRSVFYCGKQHQKSHWSSHKDECRPVQVQQHPLLGRHLVATRHIAQGELIIRELPLITGPKIASTPICLGCNKEADLECACAGCGWPMCSLACCVSPTHLPECELMQSKGFVANITESNRALPDYAFITPLRALLLPQNKQKTFRALQSHLETRKQTPLYNLLRFNVSGFLKDQLEMAFSEEEILEACAILDTNAFEMRRGRIKFRGLFPLVSMMAHDCVPNTKHAFDAKDAILLFATVDIAKGDAVTATYTQPLWNTMARRSHLRAAKCFDCACQRCADPAEMATFVSAIKCTNCTTGKLISTEPLNDDASWTCNECEMEVAAVEIKWFNQSLSKEIESLPKSGPEHLELFLNKYETTLHPTNSHILQVKFALVQFYGNARGFSLTELTNEQIRRKIELAESLLEVVSILEPGKSRTWAQLQLELQPALALAAKSDFETGKLAKNNVQEFLEASMKKLKEVADIVNTEDELFPRASEIMHRTINLVDPHKFAII